MIDREKKLPIYVLLVGACLLTLGYGLMHLSHRNNNHVSEQELEQLKVEIERLDNLSKKGYKNTGE